MGVELTGLMHPLSVFGFVLLAITTSLLLIFLYQSVQK